MNIFDFINGGFEFLGAPFIFLSVIKLYRQKQVKGVSWVHAGFFTVWGWWNLLYYPALGQWASFAGGIAIVIVNTIWMGQMIYYSKRKRLDFLKMVCCEICRFNVAGKCVNKKSNYYNWSSDLPGWCEKGQVVIKPLNVSKQGRVEEFKTAYEKEPPFAVHCATCKYHIGQKCINSKSSYFNQTTRMSYWCAWGKRRAKNNDDVCVPFGGCDG